MKIRTGFVSNSSSSSFCIVGFKISKDEWASDEYDEYQEFDHNRGEYIIGKSVASIDEYDYEEILIEDFIKAYTKVKVKYPDKDIKLYSGVIYNG
jgi:hypothetical protein